MNGSLVPVAKRPPLSWITPRETQRISFLLVSLRLIFSDVVFEWFGSVEKELIGPELGRTPRCSWWGDETWRKELSSSPFHSGHPVLLISGFRRSSVMGVNSGGFVYWLHPLHSVPGSCVNSRGTGCPVLVEDQPSLSQRMSGRRRSKSSADVVRRFGRWSRRRHRSQSRTRPTSSHRLDFLS